MAKALTISKVSSLTGLAVDTIRFYERKGLIPSPGRNEAGYRIYTADIIERIRFVKRARGFDFSLNEIEELLKIASAGPSVCVGMKDRLQRRVVEIDQNIAHLKDVRERIVDLMSDVCVERPCNDCHLINAIRCAPTS